MPKRPHGDGPFRVDLTPDETLLAEVGQQDPANPFLTPAYSRARRAMGELPIVLIDGTQPSGVKLTVAFLRVGRTSRALDIPSLPMSPSIAFFSGVGRLSRDHGIYETIFNTYASPSVTVPPLTRELERVPRTEHYFDLGVSPELWKVGRTHRQRIRQSEKLGIQVVRHTGQDALRAHRELIGASFRRRQRRGESLELQQDDLEACCLLENGAAEIFQAIQGTEIVSSMLVLRAPRGGYDHSSGTSAEGMAVGASHYLIHSVARILQGEGCTQFNLGGTRDSEEGLRAFKVAFGTHAVRSEMVRASLCSAVRRLSVDAARAALRYARVIRSRRFRR